MHTFFPATVYEGCLLGSDSFCACLLIGPILGSRWKRTGLATTFGLCDGIAAVVGAGTPHLVPTLPEGLVYAAIVVVAGLAARVGALWLLPVPFILALDNFASGAPASEAPLLAISSAIAAFAGMAASGAAWSMGRSLIQIRSRSLTQPTRAAGL